jgi:antirestriction protein ArdC
MKKKASIDKFQLLTDKLLTLMEQGVKPWEKPWHSAGYGNAITGHQYQGTNPLLAAIDCLIHDYSSPLFIGFAQAKEQGWQIRKGSKATWLLWGGTACKEVTNEDTGETEKRYFNSFRWLNVFNLDCVDDSESDRKIADVVQAKGSGTTNAEPRLEDAEALITAQNAVVKFGGNMACYSSSADKIQMPRYEDFTGAEAYYATFIHELSHWTGHPSRLDRKLGNKFGSQAYAYEELIAELSAAFVCNELGMNSELENHASYLDNWLQVLRSDKKAFIKAAGQAQKAAGLLLTNAEMKAEPVSTAA